MATKYRRKQCWPRRIVRPPEDSGSDSSESACIDVGLHVTENLVNSERTSSDVEPENEPTPEQGVVDFSNTNTAEGLGGETKESSSVLRTSSDLHSISSLANFIFPYQTFMYNSQQNLPRQFENFPSSSSSSYSLIPEILHKAALTNLHVAREQQSFLCYHCDQVFDNKPTLEMHVRMYHISNTCTTSSPGEMKAGQSHYHECVECGKSFTHRWNLTQHIRTHVAQQGKAFMCPFCPKVFSHDCNRKIHIRAHTGEKPYECEICERRFSHKHNMRVHLRTHTREKPYKCPDCSKAFSHVSALKIHARVHTGEKPYTCDVCGKPFSHSSTLNVHKRRHTGEKPFQCTLCDKTFARECTLKTHFKTHMEIGIQMACMKATSDMSMDIGK